MGLQVNVDNSNGTGQKCKTGGCWKTAGEHIRKHYVLQKFMVQLHLEYQMLFSVPSLKEQNLVQEMMCLWWQYLTVVMMMSQQASIESKLYEKTIPGHLQTGTSGLREVFKTAGSTDTGIREQSTHSVFKVLKQKKREKLCTLKNWNVSMHCCKVWQLGEQLHSRSYWTNLQEDIFSRIINFPVSEIAES